MNYFRHNDIIEMSSSQPIVYFIGIFFLKYIFGTIVF